MYSCVVFNTNSKKKTARFGFSRFGLSLINKWIVQKYTELKITPYTGRPKINGGCNQPNSNQRDLMFALFDANPPIFPSIRYRNGGGHFIIIIIIIIII